jgi:hypothetical protein
VSIYKVTQKQKASAAMDGSQFMISERGTQHA